MRTCDLGSVTTSSPFSNFASIPSTATSSGSCHESFSGERRRRRRAAGPAVFRGRVARNLQASALQRDVYSLARVACTAQERRLNKMTTSTSAHTIKFFELERSLSSILLKDHFFASSTRNRSTLPW